MKRVHSSQKIAACKFDFKGGYAAKRLDVFSKLPHRVQELLFALYENPETADYNFLMGLTDDYLLQLTPIEMLFSIAFDVVTQAKVEDTPRELEYEVAVNSPVENMISDTRICSQESIIADGKKYVVDFLFNGGYGNFAKWIDSIKVVIECDGHEFHQKTKEQVAHDNERELDLQIAGYDVIRFSGSQLYDDPLGCAEKAYAYIANKIQQKITR